MESGDKPGTALYLPLAVTQSLFHIDMDKEKSKEIPIFATMQKNTKEAEMLSSHGSEQNKKAALKSIADSGNPSEYWRAAKKVSNSGTKPKVKLREGDALIENEEQTE